MQNSSITQLIIGTAVGIGMTVVAITAVAHPPVESPEVVVQETLLTNRHVSPSSETDFRLSDRQQLKSYFDGLRRP